MGNNLPPGVTNSMIEEQSDTRCIECGELIPECNIEYHFSEANYESRQPEQEGWIYTCQICGHVWAE